ncbi:hypothetical protein UlMin_006399 [Ulmus minor]
MAEEGGGDTVPNRALKDYSILNVGVSSIQRPPIQANNFEIKPAIIQMIQNSVQFGGLPNDDPNLHIVNFLEICDTFKHNGRFKDLLRKCPHHGLPLWMQVQTFYNGLLSHTQTMVDAASGGAFFNKTPEDGYELIKVMASNNFLKSSDRNSQKRTADVHDIDAFNKLAAQIALLNNNFKNLNISSISNVVCDLCVGNHSNMECQFGSQAQ